MDSLERDTGTVGVREQMFWDEHVPGLAHCVSAFERGPDPNTRAMLDAVEPLRGRRVLDFACGAGVTSAFLAQRGAVVTGIDISPASIGRARELAESIGLPIEFITGELTPGIFPPGSFDSIVVTTRSITSICLPSLRSSARSSYRVAEEPSSRPWGSIPF